MQIKLLKKKRFSAFKKFVNFEGFFPDSDQKWLLEASSSGFHPE